MKRKTLDAYRKQIIPAIIFSLLTIIIWRVGPEISISNKIPLASPEIRFLLIASLLIGWLIKFLFFDHHAPQANHHKQQTPPETHPKLLALQKRFQGAVDFLKKTIIDKHGATVNLANLPWYLMIGPTGGGKTSLLAHSNINFILAKKFKQEHGHKILPSDTCDWWVTRDIVLVDTPGHYLSDQANPIAKTLWDGLIQSMKTIHHLNGVVIVLNLPELVKTKNSQQKSQLVQDIKKRISHLREHSGPQLPFYLVITKCDLIPGFVEFFSESGSDELAQAWGITLPTLQENEKLLDVFNHRFNTLIKRLNKQLLWRLHQERNPMTRTYIKDFPLHVERLKEGISTFLKALNLPDLHLAGVYLTSATQQPHEENFSATHEATSHLTTQSLQIMRAPQMPTKPYYVRQLILQGLLTATAQPIIVTEKKTWHHKAAYAASLTAITLVAILLGHDFQRSVHKAYSIQNELAQYQLFIQQSAQTSEHLAKALPLLNALQQAATQDQHSYLSFYSKKSQQTATSIYHQALQNIVVPAVKQSLEKELLNASSKTPDQVYALLKAYILLNHPEQDQTNLIAEVVNNSYHLNLTKQNLSDLSNHIHAACSALNSFQLDNDLIASARKQFSTLSTGDLALLILRNYGDNNSDSTIDLGTNFGNPPIFVSKAVANHIPNLYTGTHFTNILLNETNHAAAEALNGNLVIGETGLNADAPAITSLAAQLRSQYVANYVDIWESQVANIKPFAAKNLAEIDGMITNLTSNHSPLLSLLQTIQENTSFAPVTAMSPKFQGLNKLLTTNGNNQQNALLQVFVNLQDLHNYLKPILSSKDLGSATFQAATLRLQHASSTDAITRIHLLATESPEPLKAWLNTLANNSWNFILQGAGKHIESAWVTQVLPIYNGKITSTQVNALEIMQFLGHKGTLANFYQAYLKPFINDKQNPWSWKLVDNQKVVFSNEALVKIQKAADIQHTLFPNEDNVFANKFLPIKPGKLSGSLATTLAKLDLPQDLLE